MLSGCMQEYESQYGHMQLPYWALPIMFCAVQMLLTHVVSSHVRSAIHGIPGAASMIRAMANTYNLYLQHQGSFEQIHTSLN